jgi:hypothetical protein
MKKFLDAVYKINVREYRIINGQSWETGTQENEQRHSTHKYNLVTYIDSMSWVRVIGYGV